MCRLVIISGESGKKSKEESLQMLMIRFVKPPKEKCKNLKLYQTKITIQLKKKKNMTQTIL